MTLKAKILKATEKTGGATLRDIYGGAQDHSKPSVRGLVYKMAGRGELEKTADGKYAIPGGPETPVTDSTTDAGSEEEFQEGEESETESTEPESTLQEEESEPSGGTPEETPKEDESEEESPGEETPDGEAEFPKPSAEEALADALNKFAGTMEETNSRPRTPQLPSYREVEERMEEEGLIHTTVKDCEPSSAHIQARGISDAKKRYGVIPKSSVPAFSPDFKLPKELVESRKEARGAYVGAQGTDESMNMRLLFEALKVMYRANGVKNTVRLRRSLRIDIRRNFYISTEDSDVVLVVAKAARRPTHYLESV